MAHYVNHHPAIRMFYVQLSTTESEPQRGPHDSDVDNPGTNKTEDVYANAEALTVTMEKTDFRYRYNE